MKMDEISLRNDEEPQRTNVVVVSTGSIFRIKLFNILLGVCLIFLGVSLLTGVFLYIKLKEYSASNHALADAILSVVYIIVAIWVIISGIICASAATCTKSRAMNAINMTFASLTICASAVAIAFSAMTINRFSSCPGSFGKRYCDVVTPMRRSYHVPVLAGFILVTCVAISIVTLTAMQVCRLGRMVVVQQHQAHIVPCSVMVQSSGVTTSSYPAGYPMSGGMTVPYSTPVSYAPQGYTQAYTTAPPGGNPQMAYTTCAGQMQPANPTAMTYSQTGCAEKQQLSDAPPPYQ